MIRPITFFPGFVLLAMLIACGGTTHMVPPRPPIDSLMEISAEDLHKQYRDNEVAADRDYKDRWLRVTGTIYAIGKESGSDISIIRLHTGGALSIATVDCQMNYEENNKVAELKPNTPIALIGYCKGKNIGVQLAECILP